GRIALSLVARADAAILLIKLVGDQRPARISDSDLTSVSKSVAEGVERAAVEPRRIAIGVDERFGLIEFAVAVAVVEVLVLIEQQEIIRLQAFAGAVRVARHLQVVAVEARHGDFI